jgi:hypothetical protein
MGMGKEGPMIGAEGLSNIFHLRLWKEEYVEA